MGASKRTGAQPAAGRSWRTYVHVIDVQSTVLLALSVACLAQLWERRRSMENLLTGACSHLMFRGHKVFGILLLIFMPHQV
eukprot:1161022-Pelagomonas_calceolata.AAC.5